MTPALEWADRIECPVLGLFGGADQGISQTDVKRFEHELEFAGIPYETVVYPGALHSFFDRKSDEFAADSTDAWNRVQNFIASLRVVKI